jgi:hypothetical protein
MYGLGVCYVNGYCIENDLKQGLKLIKSAANSGFQPAVEWIQENPDKISKTEIRLEEVKEQLEFYKDLNPEDKTAKRNRQQMINSLLEKQKELYEQLYREKYSH